MHAQSSQQAKLATPFWAELVFSGLPQRTKKSTGKQQQREQFCQNVEAA
jgi:hypothetical protein